MSRIQPQAPTCTDAKFLNVVLREYGCVRCQTYHTEGQPLFAEHIMSQSKHGVREVDVYTAIIEAAAATK